MKPSVILSERLGNNLCHEQRIQGKGEGSNVIRFSGEVLLLFIFHRTDQTQIRSRDKVLMKMKQNPNSKVPLSCNIRADETPAGLPAAQCLL